MGLKTSTDRLSSREKKERLAAGRTVEWTRTIYGSPQSKANSRRIASIGGVSRLIKSKAALAYVNDFLRQCPQLTPMFECDVTVEMRIFYGSRRNDVDESAILDAMQGRVYRNDRQVRRKIITGYIDQENPRADIIVYPFSEVTP